MNSYVRPTYTALPLEEKEALLRQLCTMYPGFTFVGMKRFEAYGQITDTAILCYEDGCKFVFVPGDTVTLGWYGSASTMDKQTWCELADSLKEYEITDVEQFLKDSCTVVRTAVIPPMLVEQKVQEIGWFDTLPDNPVIQEDDDLREFLEEYLALDNPGIHEINKMMKLQYVDGILKVQLFKCISYQELLEQVRLSGFDLPTEDEWEYLCGGGSRTLWRWGDSYDYNMHVPYFTIKDGNGSDIQSPNQFGLVIGFDPYLYEIVSGDGVILKAGDGGCNICGGSGLVLGFLPVSTYYKGYNSLDDELGYLESIGGDYTSFRRIIRL